MLTRMLPEQVANNWNLVKHGIINGLPVHNGKAIDFDKVTNNILEAITVGMADIWLVHKEDKVYAIVTTMQSADFVAGETSLMIYSLYGYRDIDVELLREALTGLKDYAKGKGLKTLSAFADAPNVVRLASALGFRNVSFLTLEV